MAEVYVKHKKTYFLVKMAEFFCNAWLVILVLLTLLDIYDYIDGGDHRYAEGLFHPKAMGFLLTVVFFILCRYLCKYLCKKLVHHAC